MSGVTIWHNPRCSKSRLALALLEERGIAPSVRRYLEDAPTEAEIRAALAALGIPAAGLIRLKDKAFKELGIAADADEDTLIAAMASHPAIIERPVVFKDGKARLGRPPEQVLDIL